MRTHCPHCGKLAEVPESAVGKRAKCTCGRIFLIEHPIRVLEVDPFANLDAEPPAPTPRYASRRGTNKLLLGMLVGAGLPLCGCGGLLGFLFVGVAAATPNAKCPGCGKQFHISEDYRGNPSEYTADVHCPRCPYYGPPGWFYIQKTPTKKG